MQYTKGRAGPESRTRMTISEVIHGGAPGNPIARGIATAHLRSGDRSVSFMVQGKHHATFASNLRQNGKIDAMVRWTGREAVTITGAPV